MSKNTKFGTFDELVMGKDAEIAEIAFELKKLILQLHPESVEVVRLGDKAASFGIGPKKMSEAYTYIMPLKKHVNLGFYAGALLPDPQKLLEGTGKRLRHVKVKSLDTITFEAIQQLILDSIAERKAALGR